MKRKLVEILASTVDAYHRCLKTGNDYAETHLDTIYSLCNNYMPSGSGFDNGTKLDTDKSTGDKLIFYTSFHHMADSGMYDGWTDHTVTVRPSLVHRYTVSIGGRDRNQFKDYANDTFAAALDLEFENDYENKAYKLVA